MPGSSVQIDLLGRLPERDREDLLTLGHVRPYARGDFVFRAGDETKYVFLLLRGRVKIFQASNVGKEAILWFCFAGELFGLAEAARGGERVVSAQACDYSDILCIRHEKFTQFLESHARTALVIVQVLSCRLRVLGDVVINLISDDVRTRVLKMLVQIGSRCGVRTNHGVLLDITLTHQEIADMIGTTRQTVTTLLGQLEREGLLSVHQHKIRITSTDMLAQVGRAAVLA